MRIAVIGAAGFVGRHTVKQLCTMGAHVISIDRQTPAHVLEKETVLIADFLTEKDIFLAADGVGYVDAVVWLAASIRHISSVDERSIEDIRLMVDAPLKFLQLLPRQPSALVYLSSIQVYGNPLYLPIDEIHPTNPVRTYGVAKLYAEEVLTLYAKKCGMQASFLRAAFIYGPGQHPSNVLPHFIQAVKEGRRPIVFGTGADVRDDIYVGDVARAIELAVTTHANGVWNIASGNPHTILDVAKKVCALASNTIEPEIRPGISKWVNRFFTTTQARDALGFEPTTSFDKGIKAMWDSSTYSL